MGNKIGQGTFPVDPVGDKGMEGAFRLVGDGLGQLCDIGLDATLAESIPQHQQLRFVKHKASSR